MELVIEKGIPAPPYRPPGRPRKETSISGHIRRMEVGDSMFVPGKAAERLRGLAQKMGSRGAIEKGRKFIARNVEGGARIWRTA